MSEAQCLEYMKKLTHWHLQFVTEQRHNPTIILPLWQHVRDTMEKKATIANMVEVFMMCRVNCHGAGSIFCNEVINFAPKKSIYRIAVLKFETWEASEKNCELKKVIQLLL